MIGGILKAVSVKPVTMAFTFGSLANVMVYASALVGYVVKKVLDKLSAKIIYWKQGSWAMEGRFMSLTWAVP